MLAWARDGGRDGLPRDMANLWQHRYALYLGEGFTEAYNCQNSLNCVLYVNVVYYT